MISRRLALTTLPLWTFLFLISGCAKLAGTESKPASISRSPSDQANAPKSSVSISETKGDSRNWPYYSHDEFDGEHLRLLWNVAKTNATVSAGRLHLTNPCSTEGTVAIKGLHQVSEPRIYLRGPWAMECQMIMPSAEGHAWLDGGITIRFGYLDAAQIERDQTAVLIGKRTADQTNVPAVVLKFGRRVSDGRPRLYIDLDGKALGASWPESLEKSPEVWLRVECKAGDPAGPKCSVKLSKDAPWTWLADVPLDIAPDYASPMAMRNGREGKGGAEEATIDFDNVKFEGTAFDPGVYHRAGTHYLDNLTSKQLRAMQEAGVGPDDGRKQIPNVKEIVPSGKTYEAQVPDTLDLADRMRLSVHALTEEVDRSAKCEMYSHFFANPHGWNNASVQYNPDMERGAPVFLHDYHGYNTGIGEGWVEIIPLLRLATGSKLNMDVSQQWIENLLHMVGPDGIPVFPLKGRPWGCFTGWWIHDPVTGASLDEDLTYTGQYARGRFLSSLVTWYAATKNPELKKVIDEVVAGFARLHAENPNKPPCVTLEYSLAVAYRLADSKLAGDTARSLLKKTRARLFKEDGKFGGHFHGTTFSVLAMAELAAQDHDDELMSFVERCYQFACKQGIPELGFYPEGVGQVPPNCETCSLTHLPRVVALLHRAGKGDYWDDVENLARNQLIENQLTESGWIDEMCKQIKAPHMPAPEGYSGTKDVAKRMIGGFASYTAPNDFFRQIMHAPGPIIGCCTGNGACCLYQIWNTILEKDEKGLRVNLGLNRASQWADLDSYLPNQGKLALHMKETLPVAMRIPKWADLKQVKFTVDGKLRAVKWNGQYAELGEVKAGQTAVAEFPVTERTTEYNMGDYTVKYTIRGNTVVSMTPPGKVCPLYQNREGMRDAKVKMKAVTRYVPEGEIDL